MVSPADSELIAGGSDERRRFMDVVISQYDKEYLEALIRYNKALAQRNTLLKSELPVEEELFLVWEEMMAQAVQSYSRNVKRLSGSLFLFSNLSIPLSRRIKRWWDYLMSLMHGMLLCWKC